MASGAFGTSMSLVKTTPQRKLKETYVRAEPVTITYADGATEVQPAYTPQEFRRVVEGEKTKRHQ